MSKLSDEQALAKANSMDWFDNQAGLVDYTPKKKTICFVKKPDLNDMTIEELQKAYLIAKDQLNVLKDVPDELKQHVRDKSNRILSYMLCAKRLLKAKQINDQGLVSDGLVKLGKVALGNPDSIDGELNSLRKKVVDLKAELQKQNQANSNRKQERTLKYENLDKSNKQAIMIHVKFKELVKEMVGNDKYVAMIREANVLADAELNK